MRFTANKESLNNAVTVALKGIAASSRLPILSGILLTAQDGKLEFQSTNLELSVQHKIPALIEEPGQIVVPAKVFAQIIKNLPDAAVNCNLNGTSLEIKCERSHFKLNTMSPQDFEDFPKYELERFIELPADILLTMVNRVRKAASSDKNRAILNGILMSVENNTVRLVATDSYRLAIADTTVATSSISDLFELIVPSAVFYDVLSLVAEGENLMIGEAANQLVFTFGNTVYVSRKIEGNFPNYKSLLPSEAASTIKMNASELAAALRRVSVMAASTTPVKLSVDPEAQAVSLITTTPEQGGAEESLPSEVSGEAMDIAFNYHYVLDGLGNPKDEEEELFLELQNPLRPGVFKSYGKINYLYLIMPVRIS